MAKVSKKSKKSKPKNFDRAKAVGISVGGKNKIVREGSDIYKKYLSQGGVVSEKAKAARTAQLRGMNKPGSSNYIPTPDDEGFENMDEINNAAVRAGLPKPIGAQGQETEDVTAQQVSTPTPSEIGNITSNIPQPVQTPAARQTPTQQAFQQAKASGVPAPTTGGAARTAVQQYTPPSPPPNPIESALEADEGYQAIQQLYKDYENVENKRGSLMDQYNKAIQQAGLPAIDTQLINLKNVIDGTEDDIRNEVTAAGGFATNSQVMAMSSARNKTLIERYNTLLDTKNAQMEYIDNMMQFAQQDRSYAQQKLQNDVQFLNMQQSYRDKFMNNAKEGYQQVINAYGYNGLYNQIKGDPRLVANAEKILGFAPGQLAKMPKTIAQQSDELQLANQRLQNAKLNQEIAGYGKNPYGTINGKEQTATQLTANGFADRLNSSGLIMDNIGSQFAAVGSQIKLIPNFLRSSDRQLFEQAKEDFVTAVLRRESGAAISDAEFSREESKYFPKPGDSEQVLQQKSEARNRAINNLYREANVNRPVLPGMIITSNGKKYRVESDGVTITEIK